MQKVIFYFNSLQAQALSFVSNVKNVTSEDADTHSMSRRFVGPPTRRRRLQSV